VVCWRGSEGNKIGDVLCYTILQMDDWHCDTYDRWISAEEVLYLRLDHMNGSCCVAFSSSVVLCACLGVVSRSEIVKVGSWKCCNHPRQQQMKIIPPQ
jgi:hypothetical protein